MPKAIIIGGGIGGLATAKALLQIGHEVEVYERVSELTEVGAGIGLWTNGLQVLEQLGVHNTNIHSIDVNETNLLDTQGNRLSGVDFTREENNGFDLVRFFHRAELLDCLKAALPEAVIHLGKVCVGYTEAHDNVAVSFADGTIARGTYLIGADGIHSAIRSRLWGEEAPRYSGYTAWRGVVPFDGKVKYGEYWGKGARFGIFPLTENRIYWFATQNVAAGEKAPFGEQAYLLERFGRWARPIGDLIEQTPENKILRNDVVDRKPAKQWGKGLATLLGDAAHPMTPNMGQGACQALEDALALRKAFEGAPYIEPALRKYEKSRMKRANGFVSQSFQVGKMGQMSSSIGVKMRNMLMKNMPASFQAKQFSKALSLSK